MTSPFDDDSARYLVVASDAGEYALWPAGAAIPAGWGAIAGPQPRGECLDLIERTWTGPRAGSRPARLIPAERA